MSTRKLRQLFLSCAALTSCFAGSSFAADLPVHRAAYYVAPFSWTGLYGGVNVGYGWGDPQITSSALSTVSGPAVGPTVVSAAAVGSGRSSSALGGFQLGYNLQTGWWVYGVETDLSVTRLQATDPGAVTLARFNDGVNQAVLQSSTSPTASIDWFGTLRARLGYSWNRALLYGTGGLAYGSTRLTDGGQFNGFSGNGGTITTFNTPGLPGNAVVKAGWSAGGGIDYAYTNHIILSLTYLHVDLGSQSVLSGLTRQNPGGTTVVNGSTNTSTNFNFDVLRAAISWKM